MQKDLDYNCFLDDPKTVDAVVRNLGIIGEVARHVPEDITAKHPEVPWQDMRDMLYLMSHNEKIKKLRAPPSPLWQGAVAFEVSTM
ncbi:DUF86 domain-containing protein, partial [Desulfosarcina sp.]|nr:DUF86 domain-containing protein [Desulfosarcina sp.]